MSSTEPPDDRPIVVWPPPQTITIQELHALLLALSVRITRVVATHLEEAQAAALLRDLAVEVRALLARVTRPKR